VLSDIAEGKTAYEEIVSKDLESELSEESKEDILSKTRDDDFYKELPHTFILQDDGINVLTLEVQKAPADAFQKQTAQIHHIHMRAGPDRRAATNQT
jgi:hypothetical protein